MTETTPTSADLSHLYELSPGGRQLLFTDARTAYSFSSEPVSDERLRAVYELVKWAPTSANINPMRVLFVRTPDGKERLLRGVAEPNRAQTASAPVTAVIAVDTQYPEYVPVLAPSNPNFRTMLEANDELRNSHGDFNTTLQAGYFILAVRAAGLVAGPMKGFNAAAVDKEFFDDGRWRSVLLVNIGHPADDAFRERLPRPTFEQAVRMA
ncbi:malonic semialdehyde reductase [Streptomyces olivaceus]|uniref:malonic semialdehyde reductase n=1 Tax=Streptomyces TaxID=1883 RepID=UPI001CC9ECBB|nr:malonic semialdehyde reductase [Streptomyces olivaceus]MBZ6227623.1 malonic semialdehyde reductase [Streptomyces olivaceus]MBZ6247493.1 malonic semialdehyde reductase [Streptomyces olivaceus]